MTNLSPSRYIPGIGVRDPAVPARNTTDLLAAAYMATASVLQMLLLSSRFRRHLWTDFNETLTHDVYRSAIEQCKEIFLGISPTKIWGPKTVYFRPLRNSVATSECEYLWHGTRQSGNGFGNYEGPPTTSQNFMNFGPLMTKNRTVICTHPPIILHCFSLLGCAHCLAAITLACPMACQH